jgi:hypothetical protein
VRIDRSDPADGTDDVDIPRRVRSATDDLDATGKDKGTAVDGDNPPDSSPDRPDSTLQTERTMGYRAVVDAAYRQYAINRSDARAETVERETASPAVSRTDVEDPERHLEGLANRLKGNGQPPEAARRSPRPRTTPTQPLGTGRPAPSITHPPPHQAATVASLTVEADNPPQATPHPTPRATAQKV